MECHSSGSVWQYQDLGICGSFSPSRVMTCIEVTSHDYPRVSRPGTPALSAYSGEVTRRAAVVALSPLPIARYAIALQQNRASPHETISTNLNGKEVSITYGRPYLNGREFGKDVAPYGQVWRLGADEATKLTLASAVKVQGGPQLAAGSYSLWAIPGKEKWTLIVNKAADVWGTDYDRSQDVARFDVPVRTTAPLEEFTITLKKTSNNSAQVSFAWGTQTVSTTLTLP